MRFKEWFKNSKAKEEAPILEKIARTRLFDKEETELDHIDPEFQAWLLHKYPKTSDDSMANDAALGLLISGRGYESFDSEDDGNGRELDATSEAMIAEIGRLAAEAAEKEHGLLDANRRLFIIDRRIAEAEQARSLWIRPALGGQDRDFHGHDFSQSDRDVALLTREKSGLEAEVESLEAEVASSKLRYQEAMDRYYAFTGQLDPDAQSRAEELN